MHYLANFVLSTQRRAAPIQPVACHAEPHCQALYRIAPFRVAWFCNDPYPQVSCLAVSLPADPFPDVCFRSDRFLLESSLQHLAYY